MWSDYGIGVTAMVVLTAAWLGVQVAWRRAFPTFPDGSADPDALAGRLGCGGCGQAAQCEGPGPHTNEPQEETR